MADSNLIIEKWKPIPGWDAYEVSAGGNVRRVVSRHGNPSNKPLHPYVAENGYPVVNLSIRNKRRLAYVHRLVAVAFIGEPPEGAHINHIDGNKQNNSADNLEYVSTAENTRHAVKLGLTPRGDRHGSHNTLPHEAAPTIRARYEAGGITIKALAQLHGVGRRTISRIVNGHR